MSSDIRHIIIGTSGHIDHGKSSLVKALTGTDPDRFIEEKERGLTIDLGYAFYNDQVAFIDVPGHEKFIKNMVAGVTTIDFVMMVVAADDSVMPQTREHLDILKVLGIERGIIVINKIDLADPEWMELVEDDVQNLVKNTFLDNAPIVRVSAVTEEGLDQLREKIDELVQETPSRRDRGYFWQPIDRSFSIQGFGTVVTGSVLSGDLNVGEEVELLPSKRNLKVRGLQRHGVKSDIVQLGDRAAVNLQGIHRDDIQRGDILATSGYGLVTKRLDVQLQLLPSSSWSIKDQDRLRLHVGTSEIFVRVRLLDRKELIPGDNGFVQFILETPIAVNRKDRFVVRKYSPPITIGGGIILDNFPLERHRRFHEPVIQHFENLLEEKPETIISEYLQNCLHPKNLDQISQATSFKKDKTLKYLEALEKDGKIQRFQSGPKTSYMAITETKKIETKILQLVEMFHQKNIHLSGISRAELFSNLSKKVDQFIFNSLLENLVKNNTLQKSGEFLSKKGFSSGISDDQKQFYNDLIQYLFSKKFTPPTQKEIYQTYSSQKKILDVLIPYGKSCGDFIVLADGLVYLTSVIDEMKEKIRKHISINNSIEVADFRDMIQASRKFAVSVLEYFDEIGFTRREGDERVLN